MTLSVRDANNNITQVKSTTRALGTVPHSNPDMSYLFRVARGDETGASIVRVQGKNAGVDTTAEDVWSPGATWTAIPSAAVVAIVSGSANDTAAGTGARTVTISGLNGTGVTTTEVVTLSGTTPVNTVNTYSYVNSLVVTTAGSGAVNAGAITASSTTTQAYITAGENIHYGAIYTVPATYSAHLLKGNYSVQTGVDMRYTVYSITNGIAKPLDSIDTFVGSTSRDYNGIVIAAGSTLLVKAQRTSSTGAVATYCSLELLLLSTSL